MKKLLSLILALCLTLSLVTAPIRAENTVGELSTAAVGQTLTGSVMAAISSDLSAETKTAGYFTSEAAADLFFTDEGTDAATPISDGNPATADGWVVSDTYADPATGKTISVHTPVFAPLTALDPSVAALTQYSQEQIVSSYSMGDTLSIPDISGAARSVQCLYIGDHCTVWGATADSAAICISASNAQSIGQTFDGYYDDVVAAFGAWHDADKDGKLAIFCYDIDNDYGTTVSSYTAGFFRASDLINSNGYINGLYFGTDNYIGVGMDCIHLDTYPGMSASGVPLGNLSRSYSTLVHEAQHLIGFSYQVEGGSNATYYSNMETYLNEAFSMAAEHMICGSSACSSRISYFNGSSYIPGTSLCCWNGSLSNYANSYLFGQYIRTRYGTLTGTNGNTIFRQILEARQDNLGGNTLTMIADLLNTTPLQLVKDFWSAVYLKEQTGSLGFHGEVWASNISPRIYSSITSSNAGSIYNGGAKFYTLPASGFTPTSVSGVELIALGTAPDTTSAIATVTTNGTTVNVNTVAELTVAVSSTGNSVVTLLKDITHSSAIIFPYVCTVDFNGHTITTDLTKGNGMEFQQTGSETATAVVKNGRLLHYELGIRLTAGNLRVENMVIDSMNGAPVGAYDDTATRSVFITGSRLSSKNYVCFSFNNAGADLSKIHVIIEDSTLVSYKNADGKYSAVIGRNGTGTTPGSITFGPGVEMYSYYNSFDQYPFSPVVFTNVSGEPVTLTSGTHSVTVNGQTLTGLRKWTTPAVAAPSNAIASVVTGSTTIYPTTLNDLLAAVDPSGLSVITLLSDVERTVIGSSGQIILPYSCTVDLNGHTWSNVHSTSGNALKINAAGSVNTHSVVKNGTVLGASVGISCTEGSLEVQNCTIVSPASVGVSIYTTNTAYNEKNRIDGCTILAGGRGAFSYHLADAAQPGIKMTITNSTLAQVNGESCTLNALVGGGDLYLGENVSVYAVSEDTLAHPTITLKGTPLTAVSGTHTVSAAGYSYSGLKKWTTGSADSTNPVTLVISDSTGGTVTLSKYFAAPGDVITATVTPSAGYEFLALSVNGSLIYELSFTVPDIETVTVAAIFVAAAPADVIAAVTNGDVTVEAASVDDLISLIDPSGNSLVTLLKDVNYSTTGGITLPFSCTIDFNGFTIATNPTSGNGLQVSSVGTENTTTILKNGRLTHFEVGIRVNAGNLVVDNMIFESSQGAPIGIYDTTAGRTTVIRNSRLSTPLYGCIAFNVENADFSKVRVFIENSVLISHKVSETGQAIIVRKSGAIPGSIEFGRGVEMYSYYKSFDVQPFSPDVFTDVFGRAVIKDAGTFDVAAGSETVTGLFRWYTEQSSALFFSQVELQKGALAWAAVYDEGGRMLYMAAADTENGKLCITPSEDILVAMDSARLFILQDETLLPLQEPVHADLPKSPEPTPDEPAGDDGYKDIPGREVTDLTTRLFGVPETNWALTLRFPADWSFEKTDGAAMTILREGQTVGLLQADAGEDAAWSPVASRILLRNGCRTYEFVEKSGNDSTAEYRRRYVYETPDAKMTISLTADLAECGKTVCSALYGDSCLQRTVTDAGFGTLSSLRDEKIMLVGNSFIGTSEIGSQLNSTFAANGKSSLAAATSIGYATVKTFAENSTILSSIRSGEYGAVFLCGLYSSAEIPYVATVKAACEQGGAKLILLPAYNESRSTITAAAATYPDVPVLDWKGEIEALIASGKDKWDFCINDAHLHSTPLAGYVGAHMIYRAIYGESPSVFSSSSVTEAAAKSILGDYIETGVLTLLDPSWITFLR